METKEMKAKKLKIDRNFIPCAVSEGDELYPNGMFVFNITKMIEYIQGHPQKFILKEVAVKDFYKEFSSIKEAHVDQVDVSQPVILAEIAPGQYNLIDGNHRMEKARRMGLVSLRAYRLSVEQHVKFLTSKKSYVSYIAYWNNKT